MGAVARPPPHPREIFPERPLQRDVNQARVCKSPLRCLLSGTLVRVKSVISKGAGNLDGTSHSDFKSDVEFEFEVYCF